MPGTYALNGQYVAEDRATAVRAIEAVRAALEDVGCPHYDVEFTQVETQDERDRDRRAVLFRRWESTLSPAQRAVITSIREEKRRDLSRADQYLVVGVDAGNRPVLQKPTQWPSSGKTVDTWAVLRSGDPHDITEPVRAIRDVLEAFDQGEPTAPAAAPPAHVTGARTRGHGA